MSIHQERLRASARERTAALNNLKKLRNAGFRIFSYDLQTSNPDQRDIVAASHGGEFYLAPREEGFVLGYNYHDVCKKDGGLPIRVARAIGNDIRVTLSDQTVYHFMPSVGNIRDESVAEALKRGHKFNARYVRELNDK